MGEHPNLHPRPSQGIMLRIGCVHRVTVGGAPCSSQPGFLEERLVRLVTVSSRFYGDPVGPLATIVRKLRQVRKEATVANDSGAGCGWRGCRPLCPPVERSNDALPLMHRL